MTCKKCEQNYIDEKNTGLEKDVFCPLCRGESYLEFMSRMARQVKEKKQRDAEFKRLAADKAWVKRQQEKRWREQKNKEIRAKENRGNWIGN